MIMLENKNVPSYEMIHPLHNTECIHGSDSSNDNSTSYEHGHALTEEVFPIDSDCKWINRYISNHKDKLPDMEKIYVTSEASQVELVTNPFLQQCLHIIKTAPEFRDLSYRASRDVNDQELLMVYRERVARVLALPVEPISLTLEPSGRCLLSVLFRPALPVLVTKPSPHAAKEADVKALTALLEMVAGTGYTFCPGLPPKLLYGKACRKYVVVHHIPFKRYNAQGCPVYFRTHSARAVPSKPSLRALCPRCLHVCRLVQSLPLAPSVTSMPSLPSMEGLKVPLADTTKQQNAKNSALSFDSASLNCTKGAGVSSPAPDLISQRTTPTSVASPLGPSTPHAPQNLSLESSPNSANAVRLHSVCESLRQLLHARTKAKQTSGSPIYGNPKVPEGMSKEMHEKNVCKLCHKQFSSNLRLSKHVQRHEGFMRNVKSQGRRSLSSKSSDATLRFSRSLVKNAKKGQGDSYLSLKSLLKTLDSYLGKEVSEQSVHNDERPRGKKRKNKTDGESLNARQGLGNISPLVAGAKADGLELEKSELGLSALIMAASMASNQPHSVPAPSIHSYSSSLTVPSIMNREISNDVSSTVDDDSPGVAKRARKSQRLASKRAKTGVKSPVGSQDTTEEKNAAHDQPLDDSLTNLNLLSTVSLLQTAPAHFSKPMPNTCTASNSPTSRPSQNSALTFPTSSAIVTLKTKMNASPNVLPSSLPQVVRVSMESQSSNAPSSAMTPTTDQGASNPPSKIPPLIFGYGTDPFISSLTDVTAADCRDYNIPLHLWDKDSYSAAPEKCHTDQSKQSTPNCGAIDLSKRKIAPNKAVAMDNQDEIPTPGGESSKNAADVIRRLLMLNPPSAKEPSPSALVSSKETDNDLQARIFASAKNFKTDSFRQQTGQVQTVVAPFSGSSPNHKQSKPTSSEIQCGYKWSGSGGLVKERTQVVRELVPSTMIVDLLGKASGKVNKEDQSISATVTGVAKIKSPIAPLSSSSSSSSSSSLSLGQSIQAQGRSSASPPVSKSLSTSFDLPSRVSTTPCALNLSKSRPESETQGKLSVLPSALLSSVISTSTTSTMRPQKLTFAALPFPSAPQGGNASQNPFRHLTGALERLPSLPSSQSRREDNKIGSAIGNAIPAKVISLPLPFMPASPASSPSGSTSPAQHSISSPSLAAILRQPPNPRIGQNNSGNQNGQLPVSISLADNKVSGGIEGQEQVQIKVEPVDPEDSVRETSVTALPYSSIKKEAPEGTSKTYDANVVSHNTSVPFNVPSVVSSESSVSLQNKQSAALGKLKVKLGFRSPMIKCEHCSQSFSSVNESNNHECASLNS